MKFGARALSEAEGTILAHSVMSAVGRLRKGRLLTAEDLEALGAAGHREVVVAALERDDVHENEAAARLADALQGSGVSLSKAFTGRVNLLADGPGIARLDAAALQAVNAQDPMITVATVPPMQQMTAGGMLATVKIISYAVTETALATALSRAGQGSVALAQPQLASAALIITETPGGAGTKGRAAVEGRLEALDVDLREVRVVPHTVAALAAAIAEVKSALILILTGSATSDIADVAPVAVKAAGGTVSRFGMPVDPGNLLFLGDFQRRPVIGLPGCARSPALNGADWVLSRIICGVPVESTDIAQMGVGGLLKEIPSRPQPRKGEQDARP
ncbi:MAG: molybdopterin-binding protein [Pseudomonadota bacterium]